MAVLTTTAIPTQTNPLSQFQVKNLMSKSNLVAPKISSGTLDMIEAKRKTGAIVISIVSVMVILVITFLMYKVNCLCPTREIRL